MSVLAVAAAGPETKIADGATSTPAADATRLRATLVDLESRPNSNLESDDSLHRRQDRCQGPEVLEALDEHATHGGDDSLMDAQTSHTDDDQTAQSCSPVRKTTLQVIIPTTREVPAAARPHGLPRSNRSMNPSVRKGSSTSATHMGSEHSSHGERSSETSSIVEARQRRNMAVGNAVTESEARMTTAEKTQMKDVVKKIMNDKVRANWQWRWPQPESALEQKSTMLSTPNEDLRTLGDEYWRERDEWESDDSEVEAANGHASNGAEADIQQSSRDEATVAQVLLNIKRAKQKTRRRRRLAAELAWNDGLQCYHERQQEWTCARYHPPPLRTRSPSPPSEIKIVDFAPQTPTSADAPLFDNDLGPNTIDLPITQIPIAPPLLPSTIKLRDAITPANYGLIYDKIVTMSATPTMPINLSHIVSACVQGWKRHGEWPPKATPGEGPPIARRKRSSKAIEDLFAKDKERLFAVDKEGEGSEKGKGKGLRRGIQRILGLGETNGNATSTTR